MIEIVTLPTDLSHLNRFQRRQEGHFTYVVIREGESTNLHCPQLRAVLQIELATGHRKHGIGIHILRETVGAHNHAFQLIQGRDLHSVRVAEGIVHEHDALHLVESREVQCSLRLSPRRVLIEDDFRHNTTEGEKLADARHDSKWRTNEIGVVRQGPNA